MDGVFAAEGSKGAYTTITRYVSMTRGGTQLDFRFGALASV